MNEGYHQKETNEITSRSKEDQLQHINQALSFHQGIFPLISHSAPFVKLGQLLAIIWAVSNSKIESVSVGKLNSNWKYQDRVHGGAKNEPSLSSVPCTIYLIPQNISNFSLCKSHSLSTNWSKTFIRRAACLNPDSKTSHYWIPQRVSCSK